MRPLLGLAGLPASPPAGARRQAGTSHRRQSRATSPPAANPACTVSSSQLSSTDILSEKRFKECSYCVVKANL